jgi:hypothetical protein
MSEEPKADFFTIISSDMIAEVMERYFNVEMFKKTVKIVDLQATESGYMFGLTYTRGEVTKIQKGEVLEPVNNVEMLQKPKNNVAMSTRENRKVKNATEKG